MTDVIVRCGMEFPFSVAFVKPGFLFCFLLLVLFCFLSV